MFMAAHKGSGEFFRVKGLSKIALRTASNAAFFISLYDCAGAEENQKFFIERSDQSAEFDSVNFRHPVIKQDRTKTSGEKWLHNLGGIAPHRHSKARVA